MVGRFHLLDGEVGWPPAGDVWEIVDISFGQSTDWRLRLELERGSDAGRMVFSDPVSFRVHDEGELLTYWIARGEQEVGAGTLYSLDDSKLLGELSQGVSGRRALKHFVVAGIDICVEVIGTDAPEVVMTSPYPT